MKIREIRAEAFRIPTDLPESDGTLKWNSTTLFVVHVSADDLEGLGYTYAHACLKSLIEDYLSFVLVGGDAFHIERHWNALHHTVRNLGDTGLCCMAIAAIDAALWDLKAKLLNVPMAILLGCSREAIPVYGSGGFTSYSPEQMQTQLTEWTKQGICRFKIKIGRDERADPSALCWPVNPLGPIRSFSWMPMAPTRLHKH